MGKLGIPNIYKLIVHQTVNLIFKVKHNTMPEAFLTKFQIVQHKYSRRHRKIILKSPKLPLSFRVCYPLRWTLSLEWTSWHIFKSNNLSSGFERKSWRISNKTKKRNKIFNKTLNYFLLHFLKTWIKPPMSNGAEWMHLLKQIDNKFC